MKKIGIVLLVGIVLLTGCGKTIDEKNEGKNDEIINNVKDKDTLENLQKVDENILLTSLFLVITLKRLSEPIKTKG